MKLIQLVGKPAIYLYPTKKEKISIIHDFKGKILTTYPAYDRSWEVIAEPDGKLLNIKDNRYYNYLFWDGEFQFSDDHYVFDSGFYVEKKNLVNFLQEKLTHIGLNAVELNDFIIYWLPILNRNELNFIHFSINDNISNSSFLEVTPKPDTEIVIFMEFKRIEKGEKQQNLKEQILQAFERNGFTLVEWGGSEINKLKIQ